MSRVFKHLDLSALPNEWVAGHFGSLVDFTLGKTPPRRDAAYWKEGKYPWVAISDMTPHGIVMDTAEKVSQEAFEKVFRGKLVPEGSLLMSFKLTIGRVSRLGVPAFHNEAIISFKPDGQKIDDDYLRYYLSQINYKDYQDTAIKGQTLNKGKLNSLEIALPPLPEQNKIAHILSTVQQAIEAQERIIQTTTELKKALMHKLFTEGVRNEPQKQTEIGPVPQSWEESTLGELTSMRTGGTPSRKNKHFWKGGSIPWVKTGEINYREITGTEESITEAGLRGSNAKLFPKGTLLLAMYGQGITRGRVGLLGIDATTNQACVAITPSEENRITTDYLYFYLEYSYEALRSRGHGANQKNLSMTLLKLFPVAYPKKGDQEEIVAALKSTDAKIVLSAAKKATFQDLFRTLLHELMTAKTRVRQIDLPAARAVIA